MGERRIAAGVFLTAAVALLVCACSCGCGGSGREVAARARVPGWVSIVLPEKDGRTLFVGGVSVADNAEAGVEAAVADAHSQLHSEVARRVGVFISRGTSRSGIETTGVERMELRKILTNRYAERMQQASRRDSVYYRPCGEVEGVSPSGTSEFGEGPVCQVFALVSVDTAQWELSLQEVITGLRKELQEDGKSHLADLTDWISEHLLEPRKERDHD